jgi:hypothetical protein
MRVNLAVICVLSIGMSGCTNFCIRDQDSASIPGIPFYAKKGVIKQTTEYTRTWIVAKLEYRELDTQGKDVGAPKTADFYIDPNKYEEFITSGPPGVHPLNEALFAAKQEKDFAGASAAFDRVLRNKRALISPVEITEESGIGVNVQPTHLLVSLVSNTSVEEAKTDYGRLYYFNTYVPPLATSTASVDICGDGTLTKASSTVDTTKLADVIPFKDVLLKAFGVEAMVKGEPERRRLSLRLSIDGYRYQLTKYHELGSSVPGPLKFSDAESIVRKPLTEKAEDKAEDVDSIRFGGSVDVPKK